MKELWFYLDTVCYKSENVLSFLQSTSSFNTDLYRCLKQVSDAQVCVLEVRGHMDLTHNLSNTRCCVLQVSFNFLLWMSHWVWLGWILKTLIMEMQVALCQIHLQGGSVLSEAELSLRGARAALCLSENLPLLFPQLKLSAKINTVPLHLLLWSKRKVA